MPTSITSSGITFDDATTLTTGVVPTANIANGAITPAKLSQPYTLATSVASTSGTAIDFTGIPSWAKRITVMFNGVSTNGTSNLQIQIGAGSIVSTGYTSGAWTANTANVSITTGFLLSAGSIASTAVFGNIIISNISGNTWVESHSLGGPAGNYNSVGGGSVSLSGTLDRIRVTTVNGTDTFDAGSINIAYEG